MPGRLEIWDGDPQRMSVTFIESSRAVVSLDKGVHLCRKDKGLRSIGIDVCPEAFVHCSRLAHQIRKMTV
jgi:hypothetical protein